MAWFEQASSQLLILIACFCMSRWGDARQASLSEEQEGSAESDCDNHSWEYAAEVLA